MFVLLFWLCLFYTHQGSTAEFSQDVKSDIPLTFMSDELEYDVKQGLILAKGHVYIAQETQQRTLHADQIYFNQLTGKVKALGNVWLAEPTGEVLFAHELDLDQDLKEAFAQNIRVLMSDLARVAAVSGQKVDHQYFVFKKVAYTPCKICSTRQPTWQLRAEKVIYNRQDQVMIYEKAWLELLGFPILYTPYFRHPDPKVKRKSGVLIPTFGSTNDLGFLFSLPVYYAIAPNRDLTITPLITSKQGPVLIGEYRHRLRDSEFKTSLSFTKTQHLKEKPKTSSSLQPGSTQTAPVKNPSRERWHFFTQGRIELNDDQRVHFDIQRASDTTYLRRYPITNHGLRSIREKNLTSTIGLEDFRSSHYGFIKGYAFQTDTPQTTPYIFPLAGYILQTEPGTYNDTLTFETHVLSLVRQQPTTALNAKQVQRITTIGRFNVPYLTTSGHLLSLQVNAEADGYLVNHYQRFSSDSAHNYSLARFFPQTALDWRYPLLKQSNSFDCVIEPTASFIASPILSNNLKIPNEDSSNVELDDTNLFAFNRFTGRDRLDTGYRFIYGLHNVWYFPTQKKIGFFFGQSIRLDRKLVFPIGYGEDKKASDFMGRAFVEPFSWIRLTYRTSLKRSSTRPRFSETAIHMGQPILKLSTSHVYLAKDSSLQGQALSQINWQLSSQFTEEWSASFSQTRNMRSRQGGTLAHM
ncbi:MAG: LPS-assembly protein LptD, partial [Proteobacteria bacterium]|nr:LPS-assembly protein LptD [Pseudomonadota bacterium]